MAPPLWAIFFHLSGDALGGTPIDTVEQDQHNPPISGPFADVHALIEQSQPRQRLPWFWYILGTVLLITLIGAYFAGDDPAIQATVQVITSALMLLLIGGMVALSWTVAKKHRVEQHKLESAEELIQLRRWAEAAALLHELLARPMRTQPARIQALIFLATVLSRYHRFDDAIMVHDYLLENVRMDPASEHALRLARTMALLREDHLFDADRAINDLRRTDRDRESGGLALIEMYRDVKTGHPDEAVTVFDERRNAMRQQLGQRFGDAYVLLARAYDLLGRDGDARDAYERATLLCPVIELHRRYPETQPLSEKYPAYPAPAGWVG